MFITLILNIILMVSLYDLIFTNACILQLAYKNPAV